MSFFKRLFGSKKEKVISTESLDKKTEKVTDSFATDSYDRQFVLNFKANGGKFIYVIDLPQIETAITNIIEENQWLDAGCENQNLQHLLKNRNLNLSQDFKGQDFIFIPCEYLVADKGAIIFSSKQIGEERIEKLPENIIVYGRTSQIVRNIDESMRSMKQKYKSGFPSNITTLKTFEDNTDENDFRSYGNVSKNLYLLLLEDL